MSQYGKHSVHRLGGRGVDALDAGVGVRAANYIAPNQAGDFDITAIDGASRYLVQAIVPDRALAYNFVVGLCVVRCDHSISFLDLFYLIRMLT